MEARKSVLLLSGGLDSTVLLAREVNGGRPPFCVAFDYRQRHRKELSYAERLAAHYDCEFACLALPEGVFGGSALTGEVAVPHGHHEDPSQAATVVRNRNMVMLSIAAAYGAGHGAKAVLFAAHRGDRAIYADCRIQFVEALDRAMRLSCGIRVLAPFLDKEKREIVALGRALSVPMHMTWTCYEGGELPCGACGACQERMEAGA